MARDARQQTVRLIGPGRLESCAVLREPLPEWFFVPLDEPLDVTAAPREPTTKSVMRVRVYQRSLVVMERWPELGPIYDFIRTEQR